MSDSAGLTVNEPLESTVDLRVTADVPPQSDSVMNCSTDKVATAIGTACSPDCPCAMTPLGFSLDMDTSRDRAVVESAAFFWQFTRPLMYATHNLPRWLVNVFAGKNKFANRCARAGLTKLITAAGGHGGFLLRPNPGQLDLATRYVMKQVLGTESAELRQAAEQEMQGEQDPLGRTIDVKTTGYHFGAWWVPPEFLALVESVQLALREEAVTLRGAMAVGDDQHATSLTLLPSAGLALTRQPSEHPVLEDMTTMSDVPRLDNHLNCVRDLTDRDLPLLRALLSEGSAWVAEVTGSEPDSISLQYPQMVCFNSLHFHFRSKEYPSTRHRILLSDVVQTLEMKPTAFSTQPLPFWGLHYGPHDEDPPTKVPILDLARAQNRVHVTSDGVLHLA